MEANGFHDFFSLLTFFFPWLCILIIFLCSLCLSNRWFVENKKIPHCYWHCSFYATKFACDTNLVSPETRQVSYKFILQKRLGFLPPALYMQNMLSLGKSFFFISQLYTPKSDFLSARTQTFIFVTQFLFTITPSPGLIITWVTMWMWSFILGASPKGNCLNFFLRRSLRLVSDLVFRRVASLIVPTFGDYSCPALYSACRHVKPFAFW